MFKHKSFLILQKRPTYSKYASVVSHLAVAGSMYC